MDLFSCCIWSSSWYSLVWWISQWNGLISGIGVSFAFMSYGRDIFTGSPAPCSLAMLFMEQVTDRRLSMEAFCV